VARQSSRPKALRAEARFDGAPATCQLKQGRLTRTRQGRGEAERLLLNIGEILIDRADAYRLHKREKKKPQTI
jgi:hypothetical protein